jgi:hypothetical protein
LVTNSNICVSSKSSEVKVKCTLLIAPRCKVQVSATQLRFM